MVNHLVGIRDVSVLLNGPMAGAVFETAVVSEIMKNRLAEGTKPSLYYFRAQSGMEIDMIEQSGAALVPYEIKLAGSIKPAFYKQLLQWLELGGNKDGTAFLITNAGSEAMLPPRIRNIHWKNL